MKLFQRLSVIYVLIPLICSFLILNNADGDLFMTLALAAIGIGAFHGFLVTVREYRKSYLPHLIGFSLLLLTILFIMAMILEFIPVSGWDAIGYLMIAGIVILVLIALLILYSIGLLIYDRVKK